MSIVAKVYCWIVAGTDVELAMEQDFRMGRSTTEQTFVLRNIILQVIKWKSSLYLCFVDHEKALDSVNRDLLWKIMKCYGIPPNTTEDTDNGACTLTTLVHCGGW